MKNRLSNALGFSTAIMLLLSLMAIFPVYAVPSISMSPSTNPPAPGPYVGFKWNITLSITGYGTVSAWQARINYNPAAGINVTGAWNAIGDPAYIFTGMGTVNPAPAIGVGTVLVGDSLIGGAANPPPDPATLAIIEFEILAAPGKNETLSTLLSFDPVDTYVLDDVLAKTFPTMFNGIYTWDWVAPTTNPHVEVVPNTVEFDQYTDANGTQFDVDVMLMNLDVGWAITNASLVLKFNTTLIDTEVANITINTADWDGGGETVAVIHADPDRIEIFVNTTQSLSGDVLIATVTFTVQDIQQVNPPFTDPQISPLDIQDVILWDHTIPIDTDPDVDGQVIINPKLTLALPYLEVDPSNTTLGPELQVGDQFGIEFQVRVDIKNLHFAWNLIGVQFRMSYDDTLMEVVDVEEGDYLPSYAEHGTFPIIVIEHDGFWGPHVLFGDLILPNATGQWDWTLPGADPPEDGTLAIITFRPLVQSWTETYTADFNILETLLTDVDVQPIQSQTPQNGTYTMLPIEEIGRRIDVWMQYPAPYGGQGLNATADLVTPQQEICLTAKVIYNWWPVEGKLVSFEIRDNNDTLVGILYATSGADGHAEVCFRMPWPGEELFGVWTIIASVEVAGETLTDYMSFHYDYLVQIFGVSTDKPEYAHLETVEATVDYGTHAEQTYSVVLTVTLKDNLGVIIGNALVELTIGGAVYSSYENSTTMVPMEIPYNAYAGLATVNVNFLDALPSDGGSAVTPEATTTFNILPI